MATKRTTRTVGNRRRTTTINTNGKTTRSESSAGNTKPGQTRITTTNVDGKINTIRTTNLGNGWYERTTSNGQEAKRQRAEKANQKMWKNLSNNISNALDKLPTEPEQKIEGGGFIPFMLLCLIIAGAIILFKG